MKKYVPFVVVIAIVIAAILIFTNKDNDNNNNTNPSPQPTSQSETTSPSANTATPAPSSSTSTSKQVSIANMAFSPATLTVKKGTKVTWTNNDSVAHTVTADTTSDHAPDSGNISPGDTYSFTFDDEGTFAYHCEVHPSMTGTITVTE